jgi:hypothetical protein
MKPLQTLGEELKGFGGHLECTVCGMKRPLGNVGNKLSNGWPMCCGLTMQWYTRRELQQLGRQAIESSENA